MIHWRNGSRRALLSALGLLIVGSGAGVALSQGRQEGRPATARESEDWKLAMQDEVDVATARVQAKRAEVRLAESRLAQGRKSLASVEGMFQRKIVPEGSIYAARLDVVEHEARLEMRQAELKEREVRLAALKRAVAKGPTPVAVVPAVSDDFAMRMDWAERRIGELEHDRLTERRAIYSRAR